MTQVILDRGAKTIQWRKDNLFSTNDVGTIRYPYIKKKKKNKPLLCLTSFTKINSN